MIGKVLKDRYEVLNEIGNGGMATVYLAYCRLLKRHVAIKVLHNEVEESEEDILNREAKAIARVSHGNIVQIYDIFEDNNKTFIVMEYVKGQTLKDKIKEHNGPWEERDIIALGKKLTGALSHAHHNGVIHQDIKPDNIIIDHNGEPKITDFGIAHVTNEADGKKRDQLFASLRYASPEQLKGKDIDVRSDIFSLGMLLYELASGTIPFPDDSPASAAYKKIKEPIGSVRKINPKITRGLEQVIQKSLAINPKDRYESMDEFGRALRQIPYIGEHTAKITPVQDRKPVYGKQARQRINEEPEKKGINWTMIIYGIIAALIVATVILVGVISSSLEPTMVKVPDIEGMNYEDAKALLNENGLYAVITAIEYNEEIADGIVIRQEEDPNSQLQKGSDVHFVVSKGSGTAEVPGLVDLTEAEAVALLQPFGITLRISSEFSDDVEEGHIIRQFPDAGERVSLGSEIAVTLSKGRDIEYVEVPDVRGERFFAATRELNAAGIIINEVTREYSEYYEVDTIISQSIEPGEEVEKDTPIDLVISRGPVLQEEPPEPETTEPEEPSEPENTELDPEPSEAILRETITPDDSYSDPYEIIVSIIHLDDSTEIVHESTHYLSEGDVYLEVSVPYGVDYIIYVNNSVYDSGIAQ